MSWRVVAWENENIKKYQQRDLLLNFNVVSKNLCVWWRHKKRKNIASGWKRKSHTCIISIILFSLFGDVTLDVLHRRTDSKSYYLCGPHSPGRVFWCLSISKCSRIEYLQMMLHKILGGNFLGCKLTIMKLWYYEKYLSTVLGVRKKDPKHLP